MIVRINHRTLLGRAVVLVVTLAADGATESWRSEDPATAKRVELSSMDKWFATSAIRRATEKIQRGAA